MTALEIRPYDASEYLDGPEMIAEYLAAAFEEGDPALICGAIGNIARAKGMTAIARNAGLSRESLYRALSAEGRPEFATILKVLKSLGMTFSVKPDAETGEERPNAEAAPGKTERKRGRRRTQTAKAA